jgi:response regulator NasT
VKVLLADDDATRAHDLMHLLAADETLQVVRTRRGELLADAVRDHAPDLILLDMSRPDRDALEPLRHLPESRPIVLFVDQDDPGFMEEAIEAGVCSYNVQDMAPLDIKPILRAAAALFRRHNQVQGSLRAAEARLRERALIDRAKAILIASRRLTETEAHRWLQRRAMAGGRRLADVAGDLVSGKEAPK